MKRKKKLALFDIDGTLITTRGKGVHLWKKSIQEAFNAVFSPLPDFDERAMNGKLERQYFRELSLLIGISESDFEKKFPKAIEEFNKHLIAAINEKSFEVLRIADAYDAVRTIGKSPNVSLGLLTGNNEMLAIHKMKAANFAQQFSFGVYGTEKDHRGELVKYAREKATVYFDHPFTLEEIIVIGDTKHDIAAAKYAGAFALGVTTGITDSREDLEQAGADLVVDSLLDTKVLSLLS